MSIGAELSDLCADTWEDVAELTVADDQSGLVATNLYSIAESRFLPGFLTRAVRVAGEAVGLVMYGTDQDDGQFWLYRLMIDKTRKATVSALRLCAR
ncbi:hypothetical protein [Nocardia sp. NPDC050175]|uniref:hypothetical protein n=1 Tax=Nocardia sp. NPDC050175 TaxID=3364317 RepID=UPI00379D2272